MAKTTRYLRESKDGWFSYRRKVPTKLVELMDQREFQKAYNTKNKTKAFKQHAIHHEQVEKEIAEAKAMAKHLPSALEPKSKTPSKIFMDMYKTAKEQNYLPSQVDSLNATMTIDEQLAFSSEHLKYAEAVKLLKADQITWDDLIEVIDSITNQSVRNFIKHQEFLRLLEDADGLTENGQQLLKILKGDYTSPEPNIEDVFNLYIDFSRTKVANNERSPTQQKKVEQDTERLAKLVYSAHPNGKATLIEDLDETAIDEAFTAQYARTDTRKRNYTQMSAAVQLWNKKKPKQKIDDPFLSLKLELPSDDKDKKPRRVWRPEEFQYFWESIQSEPRPSIKVMGLLMAYGGKPQGETAALRRNNVVLSHDVPHIYFEYAIKGKSRQKHFLPLVGLVLEEMADYIENNFTGGQDDLLFPELHRMDSGSRSKSLNKHRKDMYPIDGFLFSNYGLRHTFKPRYEEAGVSPVNGMYLFGHKNDDTSATHQNYAKDLTKTGSEFRQLKDDMEKVMAVKSWTYSYRISDFD